MARSVKYKAERFGLRYMVRKYVDGARSNDLFGAAELATAVRVAQELNAVYALGQRAGWEAAVEEIEQFECRDFEGHDPAGEIALDLSQSNYPATGCVPVPDPAPHLSH